MDLLCEVCDRSIIKNQSECNNYLATLRNKNDKSLYNKYTINNNNVDEVKKSLNDFISIHSKNFDFYCTICEFVIQFDNIFITKIKTKYFYNLDVININRHLLNDIDCFKSTGHKFCNINQMAINSISHRCNMTYEHYMNQPTYMCEGKINMNIATNLQLVNSLDRNKKASFNKKMFSYTI